MTNNKNKRSGFTLIELLITIAIFSILVVLMVDILVSAVHIQNNILAVRKVIGQTSYAMEYITRALRMAKKDTTGACLGTANLNYKIIDSGRGIRFINPLQNDDCQEVYLDGGIIKLKREAASSSPKIFDLTSDISVEKFKFNVFGNEAGDNLQPLVTIYLQAKLNKSPTVRLQTSVSQRNLDTSK